MLWLLRDSVVIFIRIYCSSTSRLIQKIALPVHEIVELTGKSVFNVHDYSFTLPQQHTHFLGYPNTYPSFGDLYDQVAFEYQRLLRGMCVQLMISVHEK